MTAGLASADEVRRRFDDHGYLADEGLSTAVALPAALAAAGVVEVLRLVTSA